MEELKKMQVAGAELEGGKKWEAEIEEESHMLWCIGLQKMDILI